MSKPPIIIANLSPPVVPNLTTAPRLWTKPEYRDGTRPAPVPPAEPNSPIVGSLIFSDNFNDQPDWTSGMHSAERVQDVDNNDILPANWDSIRQDPLWSPSTGHPGGRELIEILASNSDKSLGGVGKSSVHWRESSGEPLWRWNSDNILAKRFIPSKSVYAKFFMKFQPGWTPLGQTGGTKLFRISHWTGSGDFYGFGSDRQNGPAFFWGYESTQSGGARISPTYRGWPIVENYTMAHPTMQNWPRQSGPLNFGKNIRDLNGDGIDDQQNTLLYDLTTLDSALIEQMRNEWVDRSTIQSGTLSTSDTPTHDQIWGDVWHKIEFFVQLNSAPGVADGHLWMWIDEQLVIRNITTPWMGTHANPEDTPYWNWAALGGNSHFHAFPDEDKRQEWVSFDNLEIWDGIPEGKII
jgi:hypothetical protein